MNHQLHHRSASLRLVVALVVLLLGLAACTDDGDAGESDAQKAAAALDAGLEAHAAGRLGEAVARYTETLALDPDNKFAHYNLALIDETNGNYGLAERNYRSALESDPDYVPALFNLAILRTARQDATEAMALYQRAVAADPDHAGAWLNLGLLQRGSGQQEEGDASVAKAIALDPTLKDPLAPAEGGTPVEP